MAPFWVTEVRPGIAKWIYFVGFAITAIASWLLRDYSDQALAHIPQVRHLPWPDIGSTAQCGVPPSQTDGSQAAACHCTVVIPVGTRACCSAASGALLVLMVQVCPAAEQVAECVLLALQHTANIPPVPCGRTWPDTT